MYEVLKDGKQVFEGSNFECFKYILDHQPQSVHWAERYGGWNMRIKEEKHFKMIHLVYKTVKEFKESNPPKWLLHDEFLWWWNDHVLKLKVGKHIDSDFRRIKRIK